MFTYLVYSRDTIVYIRVWKTFLRLLYLDERCVHAVLRKNCVAYPNPSEYGTLSVIYIHVTNQCNLYTCSSFFMKKNMTNETSTCISGLYFILPVPNIYTMDRYSVTSQLSSTYSAHHAQHIGTKSMHIFWLFLRRKRNEFSA